MHMHPTGEEHIHVHVYKAFNIVNSKIISSVTVGVYTPLGSSLGRVALQECRAYRDKRIAGGANGSFSCLNMRHRWLCRRFEAALALVVWLALLHNFSPTELARGLTCVMYINTYCSINITIVGLHIHLYSKYKILYQLWLDTKYNKEKTSFWSYDLKQTNIGELRLILPYIF